MVGGAARNNVDAIDQVELGRRHVQLVDDQRAGNQAAGQRIADDAGLLVNLLQHEVGVAAPLRVRELPGDFLRLFLHLFSQGVVKRHTTGREDRHIPLIQVGHLAGIL